MNTRKYIEQLNGKLNAIGTNIRQIRENKNISRQSLSDKLMILGIDISNQSIFDIEKGTRTVIDYELCAIAEVLDVTTDSLLFDFKNILDKM